MSAVATSYLRRKKVLWVHFFFIFSGHKLFFTCNGWIINSIFLLGQCQQNFYCLDIQHCCCHSNSNKNKIRPFNDQTLLKLLKRNILLVWNDQKWHFQLSCHLCNHRFMWWNVWLNFMCAEQEQKIIWWHMIIWMHVVTEHYVTSQFNHNMFAHIWVDFIILLYSLWISSRC